MVPATIEASASIVWVPALPETNCGISQAMEARTIKVRGSINLNARFVYMSNLLRSINDHFHN
jgi:hypothetical protein